MKNFQQINAITLLSASLFCLCLAYLASTSEAQIIIRRHSGEVPEQVAPKDRLAKLPPNPELESFLEKAKRFEADGNFRTAAKLMQTVLEGAGNVMYSDDEQTYFSLVQQVEQKLAALPPEGLAAYRTEADAEALALIAGGEPKNQMDRLSQVVNKYFVSSVGDDAAMRLGRMYLDQYDFVNASRVFEKALTHPDLSVSRDEILAHAALCDLFLNDLKSAQQKSQQISESAPDLPIAKLVANEIDEIQAGRNSLSPSQRSRSENWEMPLASKHRYGVGLPVDDRMLGTDLVAAFQFYFDPSQRLSKKSTSGSVLAGDKAYGDKVAETLTSAETRMIRKREKHGWRPTGMILFGPEEVYVKAAHEMIAFKKSELEIELDKPLSAALKPDDLMFSWKSPTKSLFEIDAGTFVRNSILARGRIVMPGRGGPRSKNNMPTSASEVQTYGDTIASQFSIHNGVLYSIEGRLAGDDGKAKTRRQMKRSYKQALTRDRENFLVAYDLAKNGNVLWRLPKQPIDKDNVDDAANGEGGPTFLKKGGLMGAPVGYQNSIIAPINRDGWIWIYALDPNNDGATLWKTPLCEEPRTGANPWSAINVSIDGSDVLVSSGLGIVFVLNAATGQIRMARRYERGGRQDEVLAVEKWAGINKSAFDQGWSSDTIIPYGRQMICFCSDATAIESIDRETGETLWKIDYDSSSQKPDYLLGVYDGVLYAAGPKTITAYDLETRELIWGGDDLFDGDVSLGKGILTPQGVFVPVGNKILQFNLMTEKMTTQPKPVRSISVDLGGADVGNLFSDGERFWVHGGNRIYALEAKPE